MLTTWLPSTLSQKHVQIHWRRVLVDEGHVTGTKSTRARFASEKISAAARWVISGTPFTLTDLRLDLGRLRQYLTFLQVGNSRADCVSEISFVLTPCCQTLQYLRTQLSSLAEGPHRLVPEVTPPPAARTAPEAMTPWRLRMLWRLLCHLAVRHQSRDIEKEVVRPPFQLRGDSASLPAWAGPSLCTC